VSGFWAGAAVLTILALAFLLLPLFGERRRNGRWSTFAVIASLATIPAAVSVYLVVTSWDPDVGLGASPEERAMVARLAAKLVDNPDDVDGWRLLGRSYMVLGEYGLGRQAYIEAWNRTPAPDNNLKLALGEALFLTDRATIAGDAGRLIEEVLDAEPDNQRALWYGGLAAAEAGRFDVARARWTRFLAFNPPEEVAGTIRTLLAQLPGEAAVPGADEAAQNRGETPLLQSFSLELEISVGQGMPLATVGPDAALFVFARVPGERAPVAVIRQAVDAVPGTFMLSDANVMIAGRSLASFPELSLVARISLSGQPGEQSGDLYAEATFRRGADPKVALVIDRVVP
jgi:cytochrome c-type biogenesis protein CcmH